MAIRDLTPVGSELPHRLSMNLDSNPSPVDVGRLERGLYLFEEARLGNPGHDHFSLFIRDPVGNIHAGIDGHIMWDRVFLKTLWVAEKLRKQGLGTRLVEALEAESIRRSCKSVWLTALGARACHFYTRLGYYIYGTHEDYVKGEALISLRKDLV